MKQGFTLLEIMITIAVISVLVALAIPNILRSRIIANEGVTLANLKTLSHACQLYQIDLGAYPANLNELTQPTPPYIDSVLASGYKQGYSFIYANNSNGFTINADPDNALRGRYLYIDQTDIVRVKSGGPAGSNDEILR